MHNHIFLVGMPASGKSTLGKKIAKDLHYSFIDLDKFLEENEKKVISEIFRKKGEKYFREMERYYLHSVIQTKKELIISTGGGTPCYFDNMEYMNMHGNTLYLKVDIGILIERNTKNKRFRPLFNALNSEEIALKLTQMLAERSVYYNKSKLWLQEKMLISKSQSVDIQYFNVLNEVISKNVNFT